MLLKFYASSKIQALYCALIVFGTVPGGWSTKLHLAFEKRGAATVELSQDLLNAARAQPQLEGWPSACDALLEIPKVALMFLTPGRLPHERLWRELLNGVMGLVPISAVKQYASGGLLGTLRRKKLQAVADTCGSQAKDARYRLTDRQFLFTVYVHHHPAFEGYKDYSIFANKVIPFLMEAKRGLHSLTDAERLLLAEALREPLNQRFLLISETSVPMYGGAMLYQQVMAEQLSRIQACTQKETWEGNWERWNPRMETQHFHREHWMKTAQWFSMNRKHAKLIVEDVEVNESFEQFCVPRLFRKSGRKASCSSNEHYCGVVLAVHGLGNETTCTGEGTTFVDWSRMNTEGRPRSFRRSEISGDLLQYAREHGTTAEAVQAAIRTSSAQFVDSRSLPLDRLWPRLPDPPPHQPLNTSAFLFLRKFPGSTARTVLQTFRTFMHL